MQKTRKQRGLLNLALGSNNFMNDFSPIKFFEFVYLIVSWPISIFYFTITLFPSKYAIISGVILLILAFFIEVYLIMPLPTTTGVILNDHQQFFSDLLDIYVLLPILLLITTYIMHRSKLLNATFTKDT